MISEGAIEIVNGISDSITAKNVHHLRRRRWKSLKKTANGWNSAGVKAKLIPFTEQLRQPILVLWPSHVLFLNLRSNAWKQIIRKLRQLHDFILRHTVSYVNCWPDLRNVVYVIIGIFDTPHIYLSRLWDFLQCQPTIHSIKSNRNYQVM